jgi:lipopolysaccharide transport system permease protein
LDHVSERHQTDRAASPARGAELVLPEERVIRPAKRRLRIADIPRYAPIVRVIAGRDFKVKYKQSVLGPLWLAFQPLALLAAFLVAFRGLADVNASGVPYAPFALVGLSVWTFFQAAMTIGTASLISNINFVRFTPCPRPAFPMAAVIASLPAYVVTVAGAIVAAAVSGYLSARVLLLPVAVVWLLALTLGVIAISSALTVRYRDILSVLPFLLQVGLFLAPVGYPLSDLSSTVRHIVELNPATGVIEACRWLVLSGYEPSFEPLAWSLLATLLLLVGGWRLFSRRETTMADEI